MFVILSSVLIVAILYLVDSQEVRIDASSTAGSPTGNTWNSAYPTITEAVASLSGPTNELWIAGGRYHGCYNFSGPTTIYGGFVGSSGESSASDRPYPLEETVLDGDGCSHIIGLDVSSQDSLFDGLIFENAYAVADGDASNTNGFGGVLVLDETLNELRATFTNCTFRNNSANQGGVFFVADFCSLLIQDCIFENNMALEGPYLGGYGGAIFSTYSGFVNITDSIFTGNNATYRGGAIYGDYGSIFRIENAIFEENVSPGGHGGAIFFEDRNSQTDGTVVYLTNVDFTNNEAYWYGGAVCWFNGPFIAMDNVNFISNRAKFGGAVVNFDQITYILYQSVTYSNNIASDDSDTNDVFNSSLVSLAEVSATPPLIDVNITEYLLQLWDNRDTTNEFNEDRDESSTICYMDASSQDDCPGPQCPSNLDGSEWSTAYYNIQDCIDAIGDGGGEIWAMSGTYYPSEAPEWAPNQGPEYWSFLLNENIDMYGGFDGTENLRNERNWFKNPTYLSCTNLIDNKNCTMLIIGANNCIVDGFVFTGSRTIIEETSGGRRRIAGVYTTSVSEVLKSTSGGRGGGVFSNGTDITVVNSLFTNIVATKGGGIYCIGYTRNGTASPLIVNAIFAGITATRGAGMAGDVSCNFNCHYCSFYYNRAIEKGGGIYLDYDCDVSINSSEFVGNEAYESGGCIAADGGSDVFMARPLLTDNFAEWEAGCLYSGSHNPDGPQGYSLQNPTFGNNEAPFGNGDVWLWFGSTMTIENLPTSSPTLAPSDAPTLPTMNPTTYPTESPTEPQPTSAPVYVDNDDSDDTGSGSGGGGGGGNSGGSGTDTDTDTTDQTDDGSSFFSDAISGNNLLYIIIGGSSLLLLVALVCYLRCKNTKKKSSIPRPDSAPPSRDGSDVGIARFSGRQHVMVDENETRFQKEMELAMRVSMNPTGDNTHRPL